MTAPSPSRRSSWVATAAAVAALGGLLLTTRLHEPASGGTVPAADRLEQGPPPTIPWLENDTVVSPLSPNSDSVDYLPEAYLDLARVGRDTVALRSQFGPGIHDITDVDWQGWYVDILRGGRVVRTFRSASPLATSYDGDVAAWAALDGSLIEWGRSGPRVIGRMPSRSAWPVAVLGVDGCQAEGSCAVVVSTFQDRRAAWWLRPGASPEPLPGGIDHVVALCADGRTAVAGRGRGDAAQLPDDHLVMADLVTGEVGPALPSDASDCSPDGRFVVAAPMPAEDQAPETVVVVSARTGDEVALFHLESGRMVWEDDTHLLVSTTDPGDSPLVERVSLLRLGVDGSQERVFMADVSAGSEGVLPWQPLRLPLTR